MSDQNHADVVSAILLLAPQEYQIVCTWLTNEAQSLLAGTPQQVALGAILMSVVDQLYDASNRHRCQTPDAEAVEATFILDMHEQPLQ